MATLKRNQWNATLYLAQSKQIVSWMCQLFEDISPERRADFVLLFKNGAYLCRLLVKLHNEGKDPTQHITLQFSEKAKKPAQCTNNVSLFMEKAKQLGLSQDLCFEANQLIDQEGPDRRDPIAVVKCIYSLAKLAKDWGFPGPHLTFPNPAEMPIFDEQEIDRAAEMINKIEDRTGRPVRLEAPPPAPSAPEAPAPALAAEAAPATAADALATASTPPIEAPAPVTAPTPSVEPTGQHDKILAPLFDISGNLKALVDKLGVTIKEAKERAPPADAVPHSCPECEKFKAEIANLKSQLERLQTATIPSS